MPIAPVAADTIYFGGGTPSLLEPDEIARIIAACREAFDVPADAEVTLEANPETRRRRAARGDFAPPASIGSASVSSRFATTELRRLSRLHGGRPRARRLSARRARPASTTSAST